MLPPPLATAATAVTTGAPSAPDVLALANGPSDVGLRLAVRLTPKLTCLGSVAAFSTTSGWHTIAYDDGEKDATTSIPLQPVALCAESSFGAHVSTQRSIVFRCVCFVSHACSR
jgi:hypothetical protein